MNGRTIFRNSIPADRLNRDSLKALLGELLPELGVVSGEGGTGTDGVTANALPYTVTRVNTGDVLNHDLNTVNVDCIAKLPGGARDTSVSVTAALDDNGQPDPYNVVLTCPPNWSGSIYLQPKTNGDA